MTEIPFSEFFEIYPAKLQSKISPGQAVWILRRQYCKPMNFAAKCTGYCNNCQPYISDIFQRLLTSDDIKNYEAVLTWKCKRAVAIAKEQKEEPAPYQPPVDAFDRPLDVNPFQQFIQVIT